MGDYTTMAEAMAYADWYYSQRRRMASDCQHQHFNSDGLCSSGCGYYDPLHDLSRPAIEEPV